MVKYLCNSRDYIQAFSVVAMASLSSMQSRKEKKSTQIKTSINILCKKLDINSPFEDLRSSHGQLFIAFNKEIS